MLVFEVVGLDAERDRVEDDHAQDEVLEQARVRDPLARAGHWAEQFAAAGSNPALC